MTDDTPTYPTFWMKPGRLTRTESATSPPHRRRRPNPRHDHTAQAIPRTVGGWGQRCSDPCEVLRDGDSTVKVVGVGQTHRIERVGADEHYFDRVA